VLRNHEGKPHDVDVGALSSTVIAMGYRDDALVAAVNLMRHLIYEEIL
jgi:hypothetical protein